MPAEEWPEEAISGLAGLPGERVWDRIREGLHGKVLRSWRRFTAGSLRRR